MVENLILGYIVRFGVECLVWNDRMGGEWVGRMYCTYILDLRHFLS